ncbi:hypothetical protein GCM10027093_31270 [Paraburkholderia jirisanensis]
MKRLNRALIVASLALTPFVGHAVHAAELTRAQVRAQLIEAEQNGTYHTSKTHYPDATPDLAATYVANKAVEHGAAATAYGPATAGSSDAGAGTRGGASAGTGAANRRAGAVLQPQFGDLYRGH